MEFWERVIHLLDVHRMTRADLAKRLDVSPAFISISISRGTIPRADFLFKVADLFKVTPRWLLTGEDPDGVDVKYAVVINNKKIMEIGYLLTKCDSDFIELVGKIVEHEISRK